MITKRRFNLTKLQVYFAPLYAKHEFSTIQASIDVHLYKTAYSKYVLLERINVLFRF